jgi:hypothetical protein
MSNEKNYYKGGKIGRICPLGGTKKRTYSHIFNVVDRSSLCSMPV